VDYSAPLVAAKAGLWARGAWGHREGPIVFPVPWASVGAAMQSVAGIMGALMVRESTGRGQALDATLAAGLDPIDYFVSTVVQVMAKRGEKPSADARAATAASRFGVLLATRDGRFIQTSTMLPHQGKALCEVAGIAHVLEDPRFKARLAQIEIDLTALEVTTLRVISASAVRGPEASSCSQAFCRALKVSRSSPLRAGGLGG